LSGIRPPSRAYKGRKTRRTHRRRPGLNLRLGWKVWVVLVSCAILLSLFAWAAIARERAPSSNTSLKRFDTIIVLGARTTEEGNPSPLELARVTEAVQEYERGVAPRLIITGGLDEDRAVEAEVMAHIAEAQGIPKSAIFLEEEALDTIQNGCYSVRIMQSHGWHSAEVISNASHLPRAGMIFSDLPLEWRTHEAPLMEPVSTLEVGQSAAMEILKTMRYLVWARRTEHCVP
jgi:uncharacterized SAM-binding protein YcdF (DUF218 family)